VVTKYF